MLRTPVFIPQACAPQGPVKCIAGAAPFVASGGADDTVHIYNAEVW